jgi:hypothetical protein
MSTSASPRVYCIPAIDAPIVAVFRRGPSKWWQVGRWQLDEPDYAPGAWLKGQLYPRRCDLSPDGRWLCYFTLKVGARWDSGDTYCAVSRLPWLTALAAWPTCGTWTRGFRFVESGGDVWEIGEPEHGAVRACRARYGLKALEPVQFAVERQRGWREASDCPPRDPADFWDQRRNARLVKPQPNGQLNLFVESEGWPGGEWNSGSVEGLRVAYWLESAADLCPLDDVQWADWDRDGRLLVATRSGKLQIRSGQGFSANVLFECNLGTLEPEPVPAPAWAREW